ncbi:hypothetical protein JJ691_39780 [Kutzneria sp. CA-103260]|nr:hypothetical protein JJ691_39780 [Kutzneria sp. CA-103260]
MAWRMDVARRVADAYGVKDNLAAVTVAGSVGAGLADRWSDLELDCYWRQPPTDADRRGPIERLGVDLETFWDYDPDDQEWSEDYRLGGLGVTVSNFTVDVVDGILDVVVGQASTDPLAHMRVAAIQRCQPLRGGDLVQAWRMRADKYPDRLVAAMVEKSLTPGVLAGWPAREALVERGDTIAVHALLGRIEQAVFAAVSALNRIYQPHRLGKWQRHHMARFTIAPNEFARRLDDLGQGPHHERLATAEALLAETVTLVGEHSAADLTALSDVLGQRRKPVPLSLGDNGKRGR